MLTFLSQIPEKMCVIHVKKLKDRIQVSVTPAEKIAANNSLIEHVKETTEARSVYNECVIAARSKVLNFGENGGPVLLC